MADLKFGGGLNETSPFNIDMQECQEGANFVVDARRQTFRPRRPMDLRGTAPAALRGLLQLIKRDGTETTLVSAGHNLYKWDGASTFSAEASLTTSGVGARLRGVYWSLDDYMLIVDRDKANPLMRWDATSVATQTTGLGSDLYVKYGVVHRGRFWGFNVKSGATDTPHLLIASEFEDVTNYDVSTRASNGSITLNAPFFMTTPDLRPINGALVFQDELIVSTTDGKLFKLTGADSTDYAWVDFYDGSAATGEEGLVNIGNDVLYMKAGGGIDKLSSTDRFGDVSADDISRWIPESVNRLDEPVMVYDQREQLVYVFTQRGYCLVYNKDADAIFQGAISPWSRYETQLGHSYDTVAAAYLRFPGGRSDDYRVYMGDADGNIYDFRGTGTAGDGGVKPVKTYRKSKYINEVDFLNEILIGHVEYKRKNAVVLDMVFEWAQEYNESECSVPLKGSTVITGGVVVYGGDEYYTSAIYYGQGKIDGSAADNKVSYANFDPSGRGPGVFITTTIESVGDFLVNRVIL